MTDIALNTRSGAGKALTWQQLDKNWTDIQSAINALITAGYINPTQAQTLITNAIQAIVGNAPQALQTLSEIDAQIAQDENSAAALSALVNTKVSRSSLAQVALSGSYNDLFNKPAIPAIPSNVSSFANDAQYQSSTQVNAAIQAVVGAAPAALDTLQEIAAQLANDESAVSALTTLVSQKANISSLPSAATSTVAGLLLLAAGQTSNQLSKVATTGNYSDLNGLPNLSSNQIQSDWNQNNPASLDYIKNKPTFSGGSSSSSSAMTLISTQSLSSGSCQFTGLSGYNRYKLIVDSVSSSEDAQTITIQMGYGSTPNYVSSGYVGIGRLQNSNDGPWAYDKYDTQMSGIFDNFTIEMLFSSYIKFTYFESDIVLNWSDHSGSDEYFLVEAMSRAAATETGGFVPFLASLVPLPQPCTAIKISGYDCTLTGGIASLYGISQ